MVVIFVSIASYCDPQLVPTIEDCLAKAAHPEDLRFGLCWQHREGDDALPFASDPRFRILDVDWRDSHGCCWARAQSMRLYRGEDWFLQIDAHHRFVDGWDTKLFQQIARTGSPRPLLSTYPPMFTPGDPQSFGVAPSQIDFNGFIAGGSIPHTVLADLPDWRTCTRPVRARFIGAGFLFAPGRFVTDVPYDPNLYFLGEEITLTVRAFSHGYDLFHPGEIIVWHQYFDWDAPNRPTHCRDHAADSAQRDWVSRARVQHFLEYPSVGPFTCGTARTLREYEAYAGLSFGYRCATAHTRLLLAPPNPPLRPDWAERMPHYEIMIHLDKASVAAVDGGPDYSWQISLYDDQCQVLYQKKHSNTRFRADLIDKGSTMMLQVELASEREPVMWTVVPYNAAEWLTPFQGTSPQAWARVRCIAPWELMDGRSKSMPMTPALAQVETAVAV